MNAETLLRVTERYQHLKKKIKNIVVIETKWKTKVILCPEDKIWKVLRPGEVVYSPLELAWLNEIKGEDKLLQAVEDTKRIFGGARVVEVREHES